MSTTFIMFCQLANVGPALHIQRLIAAFVLLLLWLKVFDWLRLFNSFAFFIRLIRETFVDIGYFTLIFVAALSMIGCSMYMMQLNNISENPDIVAPTFGFFLVDMLYN